MSRSIHTGIALFAAEELRAAALPLLQAGAIEAIEWTFDHGWTVPPPDWVVALLDAYATEGRLYGHGLRLSPTTARFDAVSRDWLERLAIDTGTRRYQHVTEHWGFARATGLARGAPMPLPASEAVVECTVRAMRELATAAGTPVGLENLALALSDADVDAQPVMLARVLDAIDGVLLLDLHNLWCQAVNYRRDPRALAARYPLDRVRQIHVAGGGWSESASGRFRRDTHDAPAPDEVLDLVGWIVPRCPRLETVILERLPNALADEPARVAWRDEWRTLDAVVRAAAATPVIELPRAAGSPLERATVDELAAFQDAMIGALLAGGDAALVRDALARDPAATRFADQIAHWDLRGVEVAIALTAKWGVRG